MHLVTRRQEKITTNRFFLSLGFFTALRIKKDITVQRIQLGPPNVFCQLQDEFRTKESRLRLLSDQSQ